MNDSIKFRAWLDDVLEIIWGSKSKLPKHGMMKKPKRARTKKGTYRGDDKTTAYTNEAWVGGKSPKKKKNGKK